VFLSFESREGFDASWRSPVPGLRLSLTRFCLSWIDPLKLAPLRLCSICCSTSISLITFDSCIALSLLLPSALDLICNNQCLPQYLPIFLPPGVFCLSLVQRRASSLDVNDFSLLSDLVSLDHGFDRSPVSRDTQRSFGSFQVSQTEWTSTTGTRPPTSTSPHSTLWTTKQERYGTPLSELLWL
jgi:hypothetical protein